MPALDPLFLDDETVLAPPSIPWPFPAPTPADDPPIVPPTRRARDTRVRIPSRPGPTLPDAPTWLGWFARRLSPGEATLLFGPPRPVEHLLELFYAASAAAGGRLSLVEGANRFAAYRIAERGRAFGVDPGDVLARVRLARAFTAYQLVALVDGWSKEIRRARPTWLVAHELPALFYDEGCPEEERAPLLAHVAETLRTTIERTHRPLLLASAGGFGRFPGLRERGPRCFDLVRVTERPHGLLLDGYRDGGRLTLVSRTPGQLGLEQFDAAPGGEEVIAWDARSRRTGRRSRSG